MKYQKKLESDNEFAQEMGFQHHTKTPDHPIANRQAESFMQVFIKTEQIGNTDGKPSCSAIQDSHMGYRSTPHPATGHTPYEALVKRDVRTLDFKQCSDKFGPWTERSLIKPKQVSAKWTTNVDIQQEKSVISK